MKKEMQKTLLHEVVFSGIGVHSGLPATITLKPVDRAHYGIHFWHTQIPDEPLIVGAIIPEVAMHATVIKGKKWCLSTIEHLMAALYILGIDNLDIYVDAFEIPILDGSALPFVQGIEAAGIKNFDEKKIAITPHRFLKIEDSHGRFIEIQPDDEHLAIDYCADFKHPLAGNTVLSGDVTKDFFTQQVAPARTFGFVDQLPYLRQHGLAQGSSLGNTVVLGDEGSMNAMRFSDECVRHKFLDLIGDLSLLGKTLRGRMKAYKTGHSFNRLVIQHYLEHPEQWKVI